MENLKIQPLHFVAETAEDLYSLSMLEEMDDNEYVLEVITILLNEAPTDLKEMKQALQAGNTDTVCKKAHKLKSSAGIIQADKLINLLADIEAAGKKGIVDNEMSRLVENAAHLFNTIEKALKIRAVELK